MSERLSISEFARREGCDEKQVRRAIQRGMLDKDDDGLLDAARVHSGWRKANRRTLANASDNGADNVNLSGSGEALLSYPRALQKKENYLARLRELEYQQKAGELIEMSVAQNVVFELFREARNAWLAWPVRFGPLIAADLGIDDDADRLTATLSEYVYRQLVELGEPEADFSSDG